MREYLIDAERFWTYVQKGDECWEWTGAQDAHGYGRFHAVSNGKDVALLAHRIAFKLAFNESPRCVCHACDNRLCVRPDHLFAGSHRENNLDMILKGRHAAQKGTQNHAQGSDYPQAKLSEDSIPIIRAIYGAGALSQRQLAAAYGVSQRTIAKIVTRVGWQHV